MTDHTLDEAETLAVWLDERRSASITGTVVLSREKAAGIQSALETVSAEFRHGWALSRADAYQKDVADLLVVLGLGDHARPLSCHEVVQQEIIPAIRRIAPGHPPGHPPGHRQNATEESQ